MNISKIIEAKGSQEIFSLPASTTLTQLIREACRRNIGAMLITDDKGVLAGIVSERDIMRQCDCGADFTKVTAGEIMSRNLITISPEDDINKAMDLMIKQQIRHLPVMSRKGIAGLITVRDLLLAMRKADQEELMKLVSYLQSCVPEEESANAS
jgi:CBS domain-containing protein